MDQISFHFLAGDAFEMTTGQDAGSQGMGSAEDELIDQGALTGQNDRKIRFGILIELSEGVKLGKDLQPQERGLIDNQDGFYFFGFIKVADFLLDKAGEDGPGRAYFFDAQFSQDEAIEFQDGTRSGRDGDRAVFGRMELGGHVAQGGGFTGADFTGN